MTAARARRASLPPLPGAASRPGPADAHAATGSLLHPMRSDTDRSPLIAQVWQLPAETALDRDELRRTVDALTGLQDRLGLAPVRAGHVLTTNQAVTIVILIDQPAECADSDDPAAWVSTVLDQKEALRGFARIARALNALHAARVVHGAAAASSLALSEAGLLQLALHRCPGLRSADAAGGGSPQADAADLAATIQEVCSAAEQWLPTPQLEALLQSFRPEPSSPGTTEQEGAARPRNISLEQLAEELEDAAALLPSGSGSAQG